MVNKVLCIQFRCENKDCPAYEKETLPIAIPTYWANVEICHECYKPMQYWRGVLVDEK